MALYLYHFDVLEEVDVISILAGSFIYYSIPYVCFTYACSSYFILLEFWSCLVRILGRVRLRFGVESGWPASHIVWALALVMQIGFYLCLSFRVSPTNSETRSDLIYLADSSGSWLWAWSGLFPGCAAPDSSVDPHLLIVVHRSYGWKNYLGFGLHLL